MIKNRKLWRIKINEYKIYKYYKNRQLEIFQKFSKNSKIRLHFLNIKANELMFYKSYCSSARANCRWSDNIFADNKYLINVDVANLYEQWICVASLLIYYMLLSVILIKQEFDEMGMAKAWFRVQGMVKMSCNYVKT